MTFCDYDTIPPRAVLDLSIPEQKGSISRSNMGPFEFSALSRVLSKKLTCDKALGAAV